MRESTLLRQFFLPPSSIKLGRFVSSVDEPHQDFYDPTPPPSPSSVLENVQAEYDSSESFGKHRSFASALTAFLSTSISTRTDTLVNISTDQVKTYVLVNSGEWFRDRVQQAGLRKWIERMNDEGSPVYLITGYHTMLDARIKTSKSEDKDVDSQLTAPLSTALAASGVVLLPGNLLDPSISGATGRTEERRSGFWAPGEQIVAVQYRRVKFRFLSSRAVDKAILETKARWMCYGRPRYLSGQEDDMVEVELKDQLKLDGGRGELELNEEVIFSSLNEDPMDGSDSD